MLKGRVLSLRRCFVSEVLSLRRYFVSDCTAHLGGKGLQRIKCAKCGELAPSTQVLGFFDLLGEKPTFNVDLASLRERFLEAQRALHPDFQTPNESDGRREHWSALYNRAWECLKDPLCRATILYNAMCPDVLGEEHVTEDDDDDDLLDTVLEARMALDDAEEAADVESVRLANEERIGETIADLEAAFEQSNMEGVRDQIIRLRYWYGIRSACQDHPLNN